MFFYELFRIIAGISLIVLDYFIPFHENQPHSNKFQNYSLADVDQIEAQLGSGVN
jgi:hypothetical protein